MKKIYHLGNCGTCKRIIKDLGGLEDFEFQNIKTESMTTRQVENMKKLAGSYEALFSRRAMKYRSMGLADQDLQESDYKRLILEEYTFLKRPVIIVEDQIFIGSAKGEVSKANMAING